MHNGNRRLELCVAAHPRVYSSDNGKRTGMEAAAAGTARHIRSLRGLMPLLVIVIIGLTATTAVAAERTATTPAYYLVFEWQPDGSVLTRHAEQVELRTPLESLPAGEMGRRLAAADRSSEEIGVVLRNQEGQVVYENTVRVSTWLRGEFYRDAPAGESNIDAHLIPMDSTAFAVRVPIVSGAQLTLEPGQSSRLAGTATFDLDALAAGAQRARSVAPEPPPLPGWSNGDPGNRFDLLIMGDGYTSAQQAQFQNDALQLANSFFSLTPYQEYLNYVNVAALFVASVDSGADQPPYSSTCTENARLQTCCGDTDAIGEGSSFVNTAFDGSFCSYNIQRLVTVDTAKVYTAAAAEPNWDAIMVLVNDTTYGGSGGEISVVSTNSLSANIAQHEMGHSFTQLADEYETAYPRYPPCSDVTGPPFCEPNVTDQTSRSQIKWTRWIAPSTLVPTTAPPLNATDAGLWQGARYLSSGMYRQGYNCLMRSLGTPFGDVASEAYATRLYQGGWGAPAGGVDNIEPGTESPAAGSVEVPSTTGATFSATVLGPSGGPDVTAVWRLDGSPVSTSSLATGATASYAFVQPVGTYTLKLEVTDTSPIIHSTLQSSFTSSRTWIVAVTNCGDGVVDPGEQCDDGNTVDGDGCSATCQSELISGGSAKNDCLHEWLAGAVAVRDRKGFPRNRIECTDDDPNCDFGASPNDNACTFHVAMCLNVTESRFACPAEDVTQVSLKQPNEVSPRDAIDAANRDALEAALAGLGGVIRGQCVNRGAKRGQLCAVNTDCDITPGSGECQGRLVAFDPPLNAADRCTSVADIKVPLRTTTRGLRTGRKVLTLAVTPSKDPVTGRRRANDRDTLTLVCKPKS